MKSFFASMLIFFVVGMPGSSVADPGLLDRPSQQEAVLKPDVVLVAIPIRAKSILSGGTINALEKPAQEMPAAWTSVVFRVEKILRGEFKLPKGQELSLWDNMKDAADDKNVLKLLTMDFEKPDEGGTDKGWISMAVSDPYASFGIREGEAPVMRQRFKLSLARVHEDPDSFVLVKSEKL